jgi:hypothetical protein
MTELRQRMIADMTSAGLAPSTNEVYLQGVRGLAAFYRRSPDQLSEVEVRRYLLHLRDQRGVARGTYTPASASCSCTRSIASGCCSQKKSPSAQAHASAQCPVGRRGSRHPWPRKASSPHGSPAAHVCVRPAHP